MPAVLFFGALILGGVLAVFGLSSVLSFDWSLVCVSPILIVCIFFFPYDHPRLPLDSHRRTVIKIAAASAVVMGVASTLILRAGKPWLLAALFLGLVAIWCLIEALKSKRINADRRRHISQSYAQNYGANANPGNPNQSNEGSFLVGATVISAIAALAAAAITGYMTLEGTFQQAGEQRVQAEKERRLKVYADFVASQSDLCDQLNAIQKVFVPRIDDASIRQQLINPFEKLLSDSHRNDQILRLLIDHNSPEIDQDRQKLYEVGKTIYDLVVHLQNSTEEQSATAYQELIAALEQAKTRAVSLMESFSDHARDDLARFT